METRQLAIFISVAQTLSFTRAAAEHNMTQPAVSHQITALEQELDAKLFIRSSHSVKLTKAGERFLGHARELLSMQQQASTDVYDAFHGRTGRLNILTIHSAADSCIRAVSAFSKRHPEVKVNIEIVNGAEQMKAINTAGADLFFSVEDLLRTFPQLDLFRADENSYQLVLKEEAFPDLQCTDDLSLLSRTPMICVKDTHAPFLTGKVLEICRTRNLEAKNIIWCNSPLSQALAVYCGLGFAVIPGGIGETAQSGIRTLPIKGEDARNDTSVGWFRDSSNQSVKYFLEDLQELAG